ncbi:MAG: PKD domain protein, partial [Haloquadratum sp. J07HQX50]
AGDTLSFDTIDDTSFSSGTPVTLGSGATVTVDSDGSWTYDPNGQYESFDSADSTTDTFTYTVADSDDDTAQGTVTVSIAGVNDAPTAISLSSASVDQSSGTNAVVGRLSAADVDDSSHTFSLVSGGGDGDNAEFNVDSGDLRADDASALSQGDYDVRLEANDGSGGTYETTVTISVTDDIAPTITSSTPADDATGVNETTDITITFGEDVAFGLGSIILREDAGGFSDSETFDVSTDTGGGDGTVSISGRNLTITPTSEFTSSTGYAVQIDAGTLTDTAASPNDFGGIGDDATVNFTTTDSMPPTASVGPDGTVGEGESVSFDGTGSTDNVGIVSHDWDFDDGDTAIGATTTHTFDNAGTYEVELTVADALNNEATAIRTITVESTGGGGDDSSGGSSAPADTDDGQPSADEGTAHVVTGTRSDDGTASFNVADPGGDGPITLNLRGTATDDSQSGAGSDGSDAGDGADTDAVVVDRLSIIPTESATREFELSVRTWPADSIESENETDDTGTDVTAPANQGETNDTVRTRTDPQASLDTTGSVPVGYVEVTHTNPDTDIENVTFRFRIQKAYLDERDVAPSAVALYRNETDGIVRLPTENVGDNTSHYVFESTSPGLSLFTIGSSGPAVRHRACQRPSRHAHRLRAGHCRRDSP